MPPGEIIVKAKKIKSLSCTRRARLATLGLTMLQRCAIEELLVKPIGYVKDDRYRRPLVMVDIMKQDVQIGAGAVPSGPQEQVLFLQFNYYRQKLAQSRDKLLKTSRWQKFDALEMLDAYGQQLQARSRIVTANMGLVLAMAKRFNTSDVEFTDLISEGSLALLRASEKFDTARGWKFSTYACSAIYKAFSHAAKEHYRYRHRFLTQQETALFKDDSLEQRRKFTYEERLDELRMVINKNLGDLSRIEQSVVQMRFSLGKREENSLTLSQVGKRLGLTKERIRQIQKKALAKLRLVMEEQVLANL